MSKNAENIIQTYKKPIEKEFIVKMATDSFLFQDMLQDAYEKVYGEFKE